MKAHVPIASGYVVAAGDYLEHCEGGARPQRESLAAERPFARVMDPTPCLAAPDGSYRVKCEMLIRTPYAGAAKGASNV